MGTVLFFSGRAMQACVRVCVPISIRHCNVVCIEVIV